MDDARTVRFAGYASAWMWGRVHGADLVLRPAPAGTTSGRFPFQHEVAHVLTAFDPGDERPGPEENERRQRVLVAELPEHLWRRWEVTAGAHDGSHTETSVLVLGLSDDEAVALGARWGQDAIFRWDRQAWSILPCDGAGPIEAGWVLDERLAECEASACRSFADGHRTHPTRARLTGETPWGWRDGVVEAVAGGHAEVRYLASDVVLTVAHHVELPLSVGEPVRVHEEFRMLGTASGWCAVMLWGGLGPVAAPDAPETWAAEVSPAVVNLDTGDALPADRTRER